MSQPSPSVPNQTTSSAPRKPRVSLALATAFGLGYLPKAPGTFGSLAGVALAVLIWRRFLPYGAIDIHIHDVYLVMTAQSLMYVLTLLISGVGVLVATHTANYLG